MTGRNCLAAGLGQTSATKTLEDSNKLGDILPDRKVP
jgi:hypothetical protein